MRRRTSFAFAAFGPAILCVAAPRARGQPTEPKSEAGDARRVLLAAPEAAPRLSFFHAALEVPPMQAAWTLPRGASFAELTSTHALSTDQQEIDGVHNRFDGIFHEWLAADLRWGVAPDVEIGARVAYAGWDEHNDCFDLFDAGGNFIVSDEDQHLSGDATGRHDNVSDVVLRGKVVLLEDDTETSALALAGSVKIPVARARDLTNAGTVDVTTTLVASRRWGDFALHANLGVGVPLGEENLFEDEANVELEPFVHGGLGGTWLLAEDFSLSLQLEANSSAFEDVEFLEDFLGARRFFGDVLVEAGAGVGLVSSSSYDYEFLVGVGYLF